jgi:hypothetical protein
MLKTMNVRDAVREEIMAVLRDVGKPVPAHRRRKPRHVGGQAAEVVAPFHRLAPGHFPHRFHHPDAAQGFPLRPVGKPTNHFRDPVAPRLDASMILVHGLGELMRDVGEAAGVGVVEEAKQSFRLRAEAGVVGIPMFNHKSPPTGSKTYVVVNRFHRLTSNTHPHPLKCNRPSES